MTKQIILPKKQNMGEAIVPILHYIDAFICSSFCTWLYHRMPVTCQEISFFFPFRWINFIYYDPYYEQHKRFLAFKCLGRRRRRKYLICAGNLSFLLPFFAINKISKHPPFTSVADNEDKKKNRILKIDKWGIFRHDTTSIAVTARRGCKLPKYLQVNLIT